MNKEFLHMQMLAGIITEGEYKAKMSLKENTLKRNQNYFSKRTLLKDPNLGKNQMVSSPFTPESIVSALKPLINKTGIFQGDPKGMVSEIKEFKDWLQSNMNKYDMFNSDSLTAREIFDQVYGDYLFDNNYLDDEDLNESEYKAQMNEDDMSDKIPLTPEIKAYIDDTIQSAKNDGELEYLLDVGFFDTDIIDNILTEFEDEFPNAIDLSQEAKDYMDSQL